jgi:hypothetical protein
MNAYGDAYDMATYAIVKPSSGWGIQGFGDYDADGKTDVFWHNLATGTTSTWLMNGATVKKRPTYADVPASSGWIVGGPRTLRLHVIPLSDGAAEGFGRGYTATVGQLNTLVTQANLAFAQAGLRFQFDQDTDWEPMQETVLNSLTNGGSGWWKRGNEVAARYAGKVVIFLRWGGGATPAGNAFAYPPDTGAPIPPDARLDAPNVNFVAFYNTFGLVANNTATFVHELGHYFGLYHTFPGWSDDLTNTYDSAADKISDAGDRARGLDGDLVPDTPEDAGTAYYTTYVNSNACAADSSYVISGITFTPDRQNIMSYFGGCQPPYNLSPQQIQRIRTTLLRWGRLRLTQTP